MHEATITKDPTGDGYEYQMYPFESVELDQSKDAFSIAPPGQGAQQNILLGISGMQGDLAVGFALYDDGTDRANGTASGIDNALISGGTVVTVQEQFHWLDKYIHAPTFSAEWRFKDDQGYHVDEEQAKAGTADPDGEPVFVERFRCPSLSRDNEVWKPATLSLRRGQSVG